MKFRKLTDKEVLELGLPDGCKQVEEWESLNPHVSVIKSVDDGKVHVSVMGIPTHAFASGAESAILEATYGRSDYTDASFGWGGIIHFYFDEQIRNVGDSEIAKASEYISTIYRHHEAGGLWHVVLDDENLGDNFVNHCILKVEEESASIEPELLVAYRGLGGIFPSMSIYERRLAIKGCERLN